MPDIAQDALPDGTPSLSDRLTGIVGGASKNALLSVIKTLFDTSLINSQAGSYTLVASDLGKIIEINSTTSAVITVPTGLPAGFNCVVMQLGTGAVSFLAASGVTIRGSLTVSGQNTTAFIYQRATSDFVLNTGSGASLPTLAAPTLSRTIVSSSEIDLTWNNISGATSYVLDYSTDNVTFTNLTSTGALSFNKTGLAPSTLYYFRVKAQGTGYNDSPYGTVTGTTSAGGGTTLTAPVLSTPTVVSSTELDLVWTDPNTSPQELSLELQYSNDNVTWNALATPAANATTYANTGLSASTLRYYRVRAVGNGTTIITSAWSNVVNATTSAAASLNALVFTSKDGTITESPTDTFTGTAGNAVSDLAMAADGILQWDMTASIASTNQCAVGLDDNATKNSYTTPWKWALYNATPNYVTLDNSGTPVDSGVAAAANDKIRIRRTGSTLYAEKSSDGGTTWTNLKTFTTTSSATLHAKMSFPVSGKQVVNIKGASFA